MAKTDDDFGKHFGLGRKIDFTPLEHYRTVYTFFVFGIEIHKSIVKFASIAV